MPHLKCKRIGSSTYEYCKFIQDSTIFRKNHSTSIWRVTKISTKKTGKNALAKKSEIIHREKAPHDNVTSNEKAQFAKTSLQVLILFTQCQVWKMKLPFGKILLRNVRESTTSPWLWEKPTKYTELLVSDKVKFVEFYDLCPTNVFLLKQSPADQCKCVVHENFINTLKAL